MLLSPLDWGLGHTTRCVPLIQQLLDGGCKVYIACEPNSASETILKKVFPSLTYLPLDGYRIAYGRNKYSFNTKIIAQIPAILRAIRKEHQMATKYAQQYHVDTIISDNRYGFYVKGLRSIFITHQLCIQAPFKWIEVLLRNMNYRFIHRFTECWVPDYADVNQNIAGRLSHPEKLPSIPVQYIGPLSRLMKVADKKPFHYNFAVLLSGPEPQRTILEQRLLTCFAQEAHLCVLFVRGLPTEYQNMEVSDNIDIYNYLDAEELVNKLAQSDYVVARSGYTTVMEMVLLKKKCIYIPTPGQTEQEYIARKLYAEKSAYYFEQTTPDYRMALNKAQHFEYKLL